ncbi:armadillo repeat-containing protein LFR [Phalaenopsis equestris]|uniref:armadillo repeat-containing protein LFR n=1 Tax=Phalaenopsis equestris TaxID=78828 RepID=UPI0009E2CDC7|nr:armadillo repeat-containing protein LFR [Phalaenopsis equestris]
MQKRESAKASGSTGTPAKRGRPIGSTSGSSAASAAAAAAAASAACAAHAPPASLLGPTLQVPISFADQNNKRIVLALQSGLKSELTWALNTLSLLSFKEKDDLRRDATPLAKIQGLLDALLQVIDDWRDIAIPRDYKRSLRLRSLGESSTVTGFGNEYELTNSTDVPAHPGNSGNALSNMDTSVRKASKNRVSEWWFEEDGLFNLDDEGRSEKQQCAVAASNIIRNFSFMPENEIIMAQNRHCLETLFQSIEDQYMEDEELITNALETLVNLSPLLDLRIFSSSKPSFVKITEKDAVHAIMRMLESSVKAWHCAAAELLGRLIINPDNEPFLLPSAAQICKRLVDLLGVSAVDGQAAAVGALYNLVEVNIDCRLKLASERWAIDRILKLVKAPHPVPEVCRKAALVLESLVSEPQNRAHLAYHETTFAEILMSDGKYSDTFARILYELNSRPSSKVITARGVWGM